VARWAGFATFAASVALIRWLAASAYAAQWQDGWPALVDLMFTILVWPLVVVALIQVQGMLPRAGHAAGS
jgi:hypothetical protein